MELANKLQKLRMSTLETKNDIRQIWQGYGDFIKQRDQILSVAQIK